MDDVSVFHRSTQVDLLRHDRGVHTILELALVRRREGSLSHAATHPDHVDRAAAESGPEVQLCCLLGFLDLLGHAAPLLLRLPLVHEALLQLLLSLAGRPRARATARHVLQQLPLLDLPGL